MTWNTTAGIAFGALSGLFWFIALGLLPAAHHLGKYGDVVIRFLVAGTYTGLILAGSITGFASYIKFTS